MNTLVNSIIPLGSIGLGAAIILYIASKKFFVYEDPLIAEVEEALPATNCGGCGFPGCHSFSEAIVKAEDLSALYCPVGGNETMETVASIVGLKAEKKDPLVAVIKCNGSPEYRKRSNFYDGASSCRISAFLYSGETDCSYGCLGLADCVDSCDFNALYMDKETRLPVVIEENCTACNACVEICPKDIIELRPRGKISKKFPGTGKRTYIACVSEEKGGAAKRACQVACIACQKCVKVCEKFNAIEIKNNLAYIDFTLCVNCRKCAQVCPTSAIHETGFPARKPKAEQELMTA